MTVDFRIAKTMFFDRKVAGKLDAATRRVLSRFGAFVRRTAKSSLKRAKQKSLGEMTPDEMRSYRIRTEIAKRRGLKRPRRPEATSRPGDPPKLHKKPSPLKDKIYFVYDPQEKAVVIGPMATSETKGEATQALERGGVSLAKSRGRTSRIRVAARPFMEPAYRKELPNLAKWRNTVK